MPVPAPQDPQVHDLACALLVAIVRSGQVPSAELADYAYATAMRLVEVSRNPKALDADD